MNKQNFRVYATPDCMASISSSSARRLWISKPSSSYRVDELIDQSA